MVMVTGETISIIIKRGRKRRDRKYKVKVVKEIKS